MLDFETPDGPDHDLGAAVPAPLSLSGAVGRPRRGRVGAYRAHERAAFAGAIDTGLMPDEIAGILAGRRLLDAFPVSWDEDPEVYAARAVSEMFVAYLL